MRKLLQFLTTSFPLAFLLSCGQYKCPDPIEPVLPDYGLKFDGEDDYIETPPYGLVNNIGYNDFTIEARFKADTIQNYIYPTIVSNRTGDTEGVTVFLHPGTLPWEQGKPWINIEGVNYPCSTCPSMLDDMFHHIAITRTADSLTYYLDGSKMISRKLDPLGKNINSLGSIRIGHDAGNSGLTFFKGTISEVRIWNYARTAQLSLHWNKRIDNPENGLVGLWTMDEGEGQTVHNIADNSNDAILGGNLSDDSTDPVWVEGK